MAIRKAKSYVPRIAQKDRHRIGAFKRTRGRKVRVSRRTGR